MKRLLLISFLLLIFGLAGRAESNYLHVATDKGWEVIDLEKADRMTFKAGAMTVYDASGNTVATYPQATLDRMYVDQSTGVYAIESDANDPNFRISGNGRCVELMNQGTFQVFGLDGSLLLEIPGVSAGKSVDLSGLSAGVYVFRLGGFSVKCSVN